MTLCDPPGEAKDLERNQRFFFAQIIALALFVPIGFSYAAYTVYQTQKSTETSALRQESPAHNEKVLLDLKKDLMGPDAVRASKPSTPSFAQAARPFGLLPATGSQLPGWMHQSQKAFQHHQVRVYNAQGRLVLGTQQALVSPALKHSVKQSKWTLQIPLHKKPAPTQEQVVWVQESLANDRIKKWQSLGVLVRFFEDADAQFLKGLYAGDWVLFDERQFNDVSHESLMQVLQVKAAHGVWVLPERLTLLQWFEVQSILPVLQQANMHLAKLGVALRFEDEQYRLIHA